LFFWGSAMILLCVPLSTDVHDASYRSPVLTTSENTSSRTFVNRGKKKGQGAASYALALTNWC
jgi:hypothetical protein